MKRWFGNMEHLKDTLLTGPGQPAQSRIEHVATLSRDRFETLKIVILHARLSCDRPAPDETELVALIRSWNIALARVPTEELMRSLQSAIESHKPGSGPISAPEIIAGYRSLRENTSPQIVKMLDTGRIEWPGEFYQGLEKLWPNYRAKKPVCLAKPQEAVIEHSMLRMAYAQYVALPLRLAPLSRARLPVS